MSDSQLPDTRGIVPAEGQGLPQLPTGHARHCFIVMPSGRDASDQKWFRGWYEVVIKPSVVEVGYQPVLAAAEEQPGAINDEIRAHLALDPMVVVDLAGTEPEEDPNPNVMYELGIRHALGLPLVMMAWKGQRLPFDVSNQRVIMEERDLMDLELNKRRLVTFIRAAEQGKYYKPMEAVSRQATIQVASESFGEDSVLRALAFEVQELRATVAAGMHYRSERRRPVGSLTIKKILRGKVFRKDLFPHFIAAGGDVGTWTRVLRAPVGPEELETYQSWTADEWKQFLTEQARHPTVSAEPQVTPELLEQVRALLPVQPWPKGIHETVAGQLGIDEKLASRCISKLITMGIFHKQSDGRVIGDVANQTEAVPPDPGVSEPMV